MATTNQLLKGYIKPELFEYFESYCRERNATGMSQGLNLLLEEFFNGSQEEQTTEVFHQNLIETVSSFVRLEYLPIFQELNLRIETLSALVDVLSQGQRILESKLLKNLSRPLDEPPSELLEDASRPLDDSLSSPLAGESRLPEEQLN